MTGYEKGYVTKRRKNLIQFEAGVNKDQSYMINDFEIGWQPIKENINDY